MHVGRISLFTGDGMQDFETVLQSLTTPTPSPRSGAGRRAFPESGAAEVL